MSAPIEREGLGAVSRAASRGYSGFLLEGAPRFASAVLTGSGGSLVQRVQGSLSLAELEAEYRQLDESEPGLGLPITLITCGAVGTLASVWLIFLGVAFSPAVTAIGIVVLAASVAMGVSGGIMLGRRINARVTRVRRMNEIDEELKDNREFPPAAPYNVRRDLEAPGSAGYPAPFTVASF